MEKHKKIIMIAAAVLILVTLLVPPFFGKGDDGSFFPVLSGNGLYNLEGADAQSFNTSYGTLGEADKTFVPVSVAKALNSLLSKQIFDIRFMSLIYLPAYIAGMCLIIASVNVKNKKVQIAVCILTALVLCDIGYIAYLNSFYTDALYLSALMLIFGSILYMQSKGTTFVPCLLLSLVGAAILAGRGISGMIIAILSGVIIFIFSRADKSKTKRSFAMATSLIIVALSLCLCAVSPNYENADMNAYNTIYDGVLTGSSTPESDLAYFGIPSQYASLVGKTYYEADKICDFTSQQTRDELFSKVTSGKVMTFYLTHPSRLYNVFDKACRNAPFLTQQYIKTQTDADYGIKKAPFLWSWARRFMTPASLVIMFVFYVLVLAISARDMKKNPWRAQTAIFAALTGMVFLAASVNTGGLASISRRLMLYQYSTDILILVCVIWAANTIIERNDTLKEKYGVNQ